jgi:hypothetical protein
MSAVDHDAEGARVPEDLPPVQPPSAGFILQLFVVPGLIVLAIVAVWLLFGKLAGNEQDWKGLLVELQHPNEHRRWRGALGLAQMLKADQDLHDSVVATVGSMSDEDLASVVVYLRTLPAIRNEVQPPVYKVAMPSPPLPGAERPMTEAEWVLRAGTNAPMPTNFFTIDETPYPAPAQPAPISRKDIRRIRALSSWGALMPFRTMRVQVWNSTNVTLGVYELHTTELAFTKDASGWHMERIGGQIDWLSEDAKPFFSFH